MKKLKKQPFPNDTVKVLFVCLGNICRSPSAEAVMNYRIKTQLPDAGLAIDSAGLSDYHEGEPADARMRQHAALRGYHLTSISRPVDPQTDPEQFDFILAMDKENLSQLKKIIAKNNHHKIIMMTHFSKKYPNQSIPDPYYGGEEGFEAVLDMLEEATEGLIEYLSTHLKSTGN